MKRSKTQMLKALKIWANERQNSIKVLTNHRNETVKSTTIEIAFIDERLQVVDFIISITQWRDEGNWRLTSFTEMFESVFPIFTYLNDVIEGER